MVSDTSSIPLPLAKTVPPSTASKEMDSSTDISKSVSPILFVYNGRRVIGPRPTSYNAAVATSRTLFPSISASSLLSFHTTELDICDGQMAEISPIIWEGVIGSVKSITVTEVAGQEEKEEERVEDDADEDDAFDDPEPVAATRTPDPEGTYDTIRIIGEGREIKVKKSEGRTFQLLEAFLAETLEKDPNGYVLVKGGAPFYGPIKGGAVLEYRKTVSTVSPTLHFSSPRVTRATVKVSLSSDLTFNGTSPVVPINYRTATSAECLSWKVVVHPAGFLTEQKDGARIQTLSWQAHPLQQTGLISDDNCVILNALGWIDGLAGYLKNIFTSSGIPEDIHSSFVGALVSKVRASKSGHVALTIFPKEQHSHAAPLDISPAPDVLTRILILYQCIRDDELEKWPQARERARERDITWCLKLIGSDPARTCDETLFRVVELGAMEIKP